MRFNSLAFRLFATAAAWTLLVLPIAGFIIYHLYRDDVQASFDGQLVKLVNAITVDSMGIVRRRAAAAAEQSLRAAVRGDALGLVLADHAARRRPAGASSSRRRSPPIRCPPPAAKSVKPDESGARWLNVKGPDG